MKWILTLIAEIVSDLFTIFFLHVSWRISFSRKSISFAVLNCSNWVLWKGLGYKQKKKNFKVQFKIEAEWNIFMAISVWEFKFYFSL